VRVKKGTDAEKVLGKVTKSIENLPDETAFITEKMSEKVFEEKSGPIQG
jgi:hypothetical protein